MALAEELLTAFVAARLRGRLRLAATSAWAATPLARAGKCRDVLCVSRDGLAARQSLRFFDHSTRA
jgi:hypothetical protein